MPDEHLGAVLGDLSGRRGRVIGTDVDTNGAGQGRTLVQAEVPSVELLRYAVDLRAMTSGPRRSRAGSPATTSRRPSRLTRTPSRRRPAVVPAASTTTSTNGTRRHAATAPTSTPAGRAQPANPPSSVKAAGRDQRHEQRGRRQVEVALHPRGHGEPVAQHDPDHPQQVGADAEGQHGRPVHRSSFAVRAGEQAEQPDDHRHARRQERRGGQRDGRGGEPDTARVGPPQRGQQQASSAAGNAASTPNAAGSGTAAPGEHAHDRPGVPEDEQQDPAVQ